MGKWLRIWLLGAVVAMAGCAAQFEAPRIGDYRRAVEERLGMFCTTRHVVQMGHNTYVFRTCGNWNARIDLVYRNGRLVQYSY